MEKLIITDCSQLEGFLFDYFYPSPKLCQDINREIFATTLEKKTPFYTLKGLFETTINRYFLTDIKLMEHPLLVRNIISYCKSNGISAVEFIVSDRNAAMCGFYSKALSRENISASVSFHANKIFWKNSLTKTDKILVSKLRIFATIAAQFFMLLGNYLFKNINWSGKKIILWNSFANNREKIDYRFLDKLAETGGSVVIHPNPYLLKSSDNWNKSIYWLGKYSINPFRFLKVAFSLFNFRKKFNNILSEYEMFLGEMPELWNVQVMQKTMYFFLYNLLMGYLLEQLSRDKSIKVASVFRGGAAAGLIYAGECKRVYEADHVTNMLVPHGTEINPIDHFSYFQLDYNVLPSDKICQNWNNILSKDYSSLMKYNFCENVNGGRIDYAYLQQQVNAEKRKPDKTKFRIGIVLTYNSESYQQLFIGSIVDSFNEAFPGLDLEFVVKPRPNLPYSPNQKLAANRQLVIDRQDVYSFLNSIDLVIGTVSVYGVLTMVVTDAILCDIPALYYFPEKNVDFEDLGYSYHSSMLSYSFATENELNKFLTLHGTQSEIVAETTKLNALTKEYLYFEGDPYAYLESLISAAVS
jgi:hypothetical protein